MTKDRLTSFGLAVAVLGWVILVGDAVVSPFFFSEGHLAAVVSIRSDIFSIAETIIFSGFALALLGALRSGFGALNGFFSAVLERSTARTGTVQPPPAKPAAEPIEPEIEDVTPAVSVEPADRPHRPDLLNQTAIKPRNYVILPNGAVEVETLLGTRVFASLVEARDYIR